MSGLTQQLTGRVGVLDARELDDDLAIALALDHGLVDAGGVHAVAHDGDHALHDLGRDLDLFRVLGLEDQVHAALDVQAVLGRELLLVLDHVERPEGEEHHDQEQEFPRAQRFAS
ncbi:hypothetical protein D3C86_1476130 [compost metagenome]